MECPNCKALNIIGKPNEGFEWVILTLANKTYILDGSTLLVVVISSWLKREKNPRIAPFVVEISSTSAVRKRMELEENLCFQKAGISGHAASEESNGFL